MEKTCSMCKKEKDVSLFSPDRQGYARYCKKCKAEYNKELYKKHPETFYSSVVKWQNNNKEKTKAHQRVTYCLRIGKLIKPNICQICGRKDLDIEAHHWRGYKKENMLDVQWLCRQCHTDRKVVK